MVTRAIIILETLGIYKQNKCHNRILSNYYTCAVYAHCNVITTRTSQLKFVAAKAHDSKTNDGEERALKIQQSDRISTLFRASATSWLHDSFTRSWRMVSPKVRYTKTEIIVSLMCDKLAF